MKTAPSPADLLPRCQCLPGFTFTLSGQVTTRQPPGGPVHGLPVRVWKGTELLASEMVWTRAMPATVKEMEEVLTYSFDFEELMGRAELERETASYAQARSRMSDEECEARWLNRNGNLLS